MWQLGGQPQTVMNGVTIDENGTAICAGRPGTCSGNKEDDPIDLAMSGGLGETKRIGLIAPDKSTQVFAVVVPFPNRGMDAGCSIEAALVTPNAEAVLMFATGFKSGEQLDIQIVSEGERQSPSAKADPNGNYEWVVLPFKKGLTKGQARVSVRTAACTPTLPFSWGEGSYRLQ